MMDRKKKSTLVNQGVCLAAVVRIIFVGLRARFFER